MRQYIYSPKLASLGSRTLYISLIVRSGNNRVVKGLALAAACMHYCCHP